MQDSIEDYIKISRNTQEKLLQVSKEAQITAQWKKECDLRAMKIVEFSIEGKLRPEIFTKSFPFINDSYYQDIVEERAITKLCGYPVCGKKIPEMPKKQYHISVKSNKVYDITDRKNYCSNFCYKASLHIKKQLDNSPIWLRKFEHIPTYQLLTPSEGGLPGEYIDQGIVKPVVEPSFTCVSLFTEASLDDMIDTEKGVTRHSKNKDYKKEFKYKSNRKSSMKTINENPEQIAEEPQDKLQTKEEIVVQTPSEQIDKKISGTQVKQKCDTCTDETDRKLTTVTTTKKSIKETKNVKRKGEKRKQIDIESMIQKAFKDWLTLETYIFVHGEAKVKEILNEKKLSDCFEQLNITNLQREQQIKYMNICKRLQLQEMADEKFDSAVTGNSKLKPLPDYRQLKQENKDLTLKVKSFYTGMLHEKEDTNFPTKINKSEENSNAEGPPAVLPMVDVNSQNALRRKVFLSSMNKSMQSLLEALRVTHYSSVLSDVQGLVRTFSLKADNVVFKPFVWNYIAIALLHILSLQDKRIENILQEKQSQVYLELQLSSLPNKKQFIDNVLATMRDVESFLEFYISLK